MDIAVKDEVASPHYEGVGVGMAFTKIITHDINSKATNSGNTTVASPVNTATVITIKLKKRSVIKWVLLRVQ